MAKLINFKTSYGKRVSFSSLTPFLMWEHQEFHGGTTKIFIRILEKDFEILEDQRDKIVTEIG
jgi:myosin heavy subunit